MSITTVSLKTAQMLKEAGFPQNTDFIWHEFDYGDNPNHWPGHIKPANEFRLEFHKRPLGRYENDVYQGKEFWCSAPCSDELLNELPVSIPNEGRLTIWKFDDLYQCAYNNIVMSKFRIHAENEYLCEALASLRLHLNNEGLIK